MLLCCPVGVVRGSPRLDALRVRLPAFGTLVNDAFGLVTSVLLLELGDFFLCFVHRIHETVVEFLRCSHGQAGAGGSMLNKYVGTHTGRLLSSHRLHHAFQC